MFFKMTNVSIKYLVFAFLLSGGLFLGCDKDGDSTPADTTPTLTIQDLPVNETDADAIVDLEVKLSATSKISVAVSFAAASATAESGIDFELVTPAGQFIFAPGETSKTIQVKIIGDNKRENTESFKINLSNAQNATLVRQFSTITISDDDDDLFIPTSGYTSAASYPGYNLVWADEFDGPNLNTTNWTHEMGDGCPNLCGWGNNELQYYRPDNTSIVNGNLVITAKKESFGGRDYTSSRLITKGKRDFKFGRIDIRAALPSGKGVWPALWMLGSNIDAVSWPACGEIDIMELRGDLPQQFLSTVHYGPNANQHQYKSGAKGLSGTDNFQDEFHVFSMNWENNLIEFLLDDVVYYTVTPATINGTYPFNNNFFFIFNVAIGGNFPGNPNDSTVFPQQMIVDYVRVFQK